MLCYHANPHLSHIQSQTSLKVNITHKSPAVVTSVVVVVIVVDDEVVVVVVIVRVGVGEVVL